MFGFITLTGTRAYIGARLRSAVFGPLGLLVALAILGVAGWLSLLLRDPLPAALAAAGLLLAAHVVRVFLAEKLLSDDLPVKCTHLAALLSTELVCLLAPKRRVTAGDLLRASAASKRGRFILEEIGIDPRTFVRTCAQPVDESIDVRAFVQDAFKRTTVFRETRVDANILLLLLFEHVPCCTAMLHKADMSEEEVVGLLHWEAFHHRFHAREELFTPAWLRGTSIGRSWVSGYTLALDLLTQEMRGELATGGERSIVIHETLIQNVLQVLTRPSQNNVLVLGRVGVGKRTLVENAVRTMRSLERAQHRPFTRSLILRTEQLLSGIDRADTFLLRALDRAQQGSGRIILIVRDLALLLRSANTQLLTVLLRCLQSRTIAVIGIADVQDYHALIKSNPQFDSLFEKIAVDDSSDEETMRILMSHYFVRREERGCPRVSYKALQSILELSKRFLSSQGGFPAVAVHVMDDALARARSNGDDELREEYIRDVISLKGKMNVQRMTEGERERLLSLEETLRTRIIGQDAAVRAVASALKRARLDLHERKKPLGTFLFLGPTGVGKTHTAKALAEEYFGSADAMIRLDMNEFSHPDSVFGIIGAAAGDRESFLTQRVQDRPFSLILLDEIEKAHPSVLNLFLQILDEGMLTDERGVKTNFRNTIIIATSNAGALFIRDYVKSHPAIDRDDLKMSLVNVILKDKIFAPEFLNRFDDVIVFHPLTPALTQQVAGLMLADIIQDVRRKRGITVQVQPDAVAQLAERGYSMEFGARELRRTITDSVEDYLADFMLRRDVKRGETIVIKKSDLPR